MNENLFEAQYDVTKKSKLKKFYEANKRLLVLLSFKLLQYRTQYYQVTLQDFLLNKFYE